LRNPIDEKLLAVGLANLTLALYALRPKSARDTVLAALRAYHQAHNFQNHKVLHPSQASQ
jgi:hypothetical protein